MPRLADNPFFASGLAQRIDRRRVLGISPMVWKAIALGCMMSAFAWLIDLRASWAFRGLAAASLYFWGFALVAPVLRVHREHVAMTEQEGWMESTYLTGIRASEVLKPLAYRAWFETTTMLLGLQLGLLTAYPYWRSMQLAWWEWNLGALATVMLFQVGFPLIVVVIVSLACLAQATQRRNKYWRLIFAFILNVPVAVMMASLPVLLAKRLNLFLYESGTALTAYYLMLVVLPVLALLAWFCWQLLDEDLMNENYWKANVGHDRAS